MAVLVGGIDDGAPQRTDAAERVLREQSGRSDIVIGRRPSGRPRLAPPYPELAVSLSHRNDLLLAAFSPTASVGADIEIDAPDLDAPRLARDHFTAGEARAIASLTSAAGRDLFLRLWVGKEAALKTSGRGVFDGAAEPDLAAHLADLARDGVEIALPASTHLPALTLVVRRLVLPKRPAIYCGLAVAA